MHMAKLEVSGQGVQETDVDGISGELSPESLNHIKLSLVGEQIERGGLAEIVEGVESKLTAVQARRSG